ncbi:MAG: hypothetical protein LBK02_06000 [Treponema sp.]|jgi:hypothetical protein|nr:hypothetical protein [Treponema sp.]
MDRNAIVNAMEKKAKTIFESSDEYIKEGKRGMMVVQIQDKKNPAQWDSTFRSFETTFRDYNYEGELVISNGVNFDALVHGKAAFARRTGKNSGTNYYQVLGHESFWPGAVTSDDGFCICAFAGFTAADDVAIAEAGIACYESLKRTGKSLAKKRPVEDEIPGEEEPDETAD